MTVYITIFVDPMVNVARKCAPATTTKSVLDSAKNAGEFFKFLFNNN